MQFRDKYLDLITPQVMGILNVTPDSFSDGGQFVAGDAALLQATKMAEEGAGIIDVGGESTRPGAQAVTEQEELDRVIPVIQSIVNELDVIVSIDTSKPLVMREAINAGAHFINDVNALRSPGAVDVAAELQVPVCLMHMQGEPRTMQIQPSYGDVVADVMDFLQERRQTCIQAGIQPDRIIIDPGFGFGKMLDHNLALFKNLNQFTKIGAPVLVGVSRKSMIGSMLDVEVTERLYGSLALASLAVWLGASIIRAHDVGPTVQAIKTVQVVKSYQGV